MKYSQKKSSISKYFKSNINSFLFGMLATANILLSRLVFKGLELQKKDLGVVVHHRGKSKHTL